jgi:hypothetical protein
VGGKAEAGNAANPMGARLYQSGKKKRKITCSMARRMLLERLYYPKEVGST